MDHVPFVSMQMDFNPKLMDNSPGKPNNTLPNTRTHTIYLEGFWFVSTKVTLDGCLKVCEPFGIFNIPAEEDLLRNASNDDFPYS